jgi:hypothetical protein
VLHGSRFESESESDSSCCSLLLSSSDSSKNSAVLASSASDMLPYDVDMKKKKKKAGNQTELQSVFVSIKLDSKTMLPSRIHHAALEHTHTSKQVMNCSFFCSKHARQSLQSVNLHSGCHKLVSTNTLLTVDDIRSLNSLVHSLVGFETLVETACPTSKSLKPTEAKQLPRL